MQFFLTQVSLIRKISQKSWFGLSKLLECFYRLVSFLPQDDTYVCSTVALSKYKVRKTLFISKCKSQYSTEEDPQMSIESACCKVFCLCDHRKSWLFFVNKPKL